MRVYILDNEHEYEYSNYLLKQQDTLLYVSFKYKKFLEKYLRDKAVYFVVEDKGKICGVLPCFIHENIKYGNVINSLPYYGSNGAIIYDNEESREILVSAYIDYAYENNCVAGTLITSPFRNDDNWYRTRLNPDYIDKRISFILRLPSESEKITEDLKSMFHSNPKRSIKKAVNNGVTCSIENTKEALNAVYYMHRENISNLGGVPKTKDFFEMIPSCFVGGQDFNLFVGRKDGIIISALLVFYFNRTVEYFTPETLYEYRSIQPLSLLIYESMLNAAKRNYLYWNFGGTHLNMSSLYEFKRKWGAIEYEYFYYTNVFNESITKLDKFTLMNNYPCYYVYPFDGGIK